MNDEQKKKAAFAEQIKEYFANAGYRPMLFNDFVAVNFEGLTSLCQVEPLDEGAFFRTIAHFDASNVSDPAVASMAFDKVNQTVRCAKIHHINNDDGSAAISVEAFHSSVDEFLKYLPFYLKMISTARESFKEAVAELEKNAK